MPPKSHPIDGGYSWVVCLGCAMQQFFIQGGSRSLGILFIELLAKYEASPQLTALALALVAAGFSLFAATGNAIGMLVTYRVVVVIGGIILAVSVILTAYAPNIFVVILTLGLGSGMGYGFLFGPSLVIVGQYFDKKRALANGLALSGGSIGQLVIPMYLGFMIRHYGFQGALFMYAALILHSVPGALLLRPPAFFTQSRLSQRKRGPPPKIHVDSSTQTWSTSCVQTGLMLDKEPWFADQLNDDKSVQVDIPYDGRQRSASLDPTFDLNIRPRHRSNTLNSSRSSLYHAPFQDTMVEENEAPVVPPQKPTLAQFVLMFLRGLFDKELLTNFLFWMFALAMSFGHAGYMIALMFIPPYTVELWGPEDGKQAASVILSVMGIADLVGRIGGGVFADLGLIRRTWLCGFCFLLAGLLNFFMPIYPDYKLMCAYAMVSGVFGGTYMALLGVIVVDLCGLPKLSAGVGLGALIMGIFMIPFPSILGGMRKSLGSFGPSIQVCGVLLLIASGIYFIDPCCRRLETWNKAKKTERNPSSPIDDSIEHNDNNIKTKPLTVGEARRQAEFNHD